MGIFLEYLALAGSILSVVLMAYIICICLGDLR